MSREKDKAHPPAALRCGSVAGLAAALGKIDDEGGPEAPQQFVDIMTASRWDQIKDATLASGKVDKCGLICMVSDGRDFQRDVQAYRERVAPLCRDAPGVMLMLVTGCTVANALVQVEGARADVKVVVVAPSAPSAALQQARIARRYADAQFVDIGQGFRLAAVGCFCVHHATGAHDTDCLRAAVARATGQPPPPHGRGKRRGSTNLVGSSRRTPLVRLQWLSVR